MKNLFLALTLLVSLTLSAQQPRGRGNFDVSKLPKIGVVAGTLIDMDTKEPCLCCGKDHP